MHHAIEDIAEAIAKGHGYDKHVLQQHEFDGTGGLRRGSDTGVRTREDYKDHIMSTILDIETKSFQTADGRTHFYNARTNTHVAYDPRHPDLGTCQRPTARERGFDNQWERDCRITGDWTEARLSKSGGVEGLRAVEQAINVSHSQGARGERQSISEAEYFARAVDDPKGYPPISVEMGELVEEQRQTEALGAALARREGYQANETDEALAERLRERADFYLTQQSQQQQM